MLVNNIVFELREFRVALCIGLMINYHIQESIIEENEDESDSELDDTSVDSENKNNIFSPGMKMVKDEDIEPKVHLSNQKNQIHSPNIFSPLDSPRTGPNNSSTNPDTHSKREPKYLRLLSSRLRDSAISDSLTSSLDMSTDHMLNSDNEVMVYQIRSI